MNAKLFVELMLLFTKLIIDLCYQLIEKALLFMELYKFLKQNSKLILAGLLISP